MFLDAPSSNTYSTTSSIPPAPSALPAFAALPKQQQNVPASAFGQANFEARSEKPPAVPPPSAGQTAGQNPFSIRSANAGWSRPQGSIVTPPMPPPSAQTLPAAAAPSSNFPPPQMFMPAPPAAAAPTYFSHASESVSMTPPASATGYYFILFCKIETILTEKNVTNILVMHRNILLVRLMALRYQWKEAH